MGNTKQSLLQGIFPGMKLNKAFFLRIYGYEVSYPGFAETAIKALEDAGCNRARSYYDQIVASYEREQDEKNQPVASWLREQIDRDYKRISADTRKEGSEDVRQILLKKKRVLLLRLKENLQT